MKKIALLIILASLGLLIFYPWNNNSGNTEQFIINNFTNPNLTISTYINPGEFYVEEEWGAKGRESISESIGLLMEYYLEVKDKESFHQQVNILNEYFLDDQGFIYWKLNANGEKITDANALIDDLRIMKVLYKSSIIFKEYEYQIIADKIKLFILKNQLQEGYIADFYDNQYSLAGEIIHLSYLDMEALKYSPIEIIERHKALLNQANNNIFFPERYHILNREYESNDSVNLIDQVLIAQNVYQSGGNIQSFLNFIRERYTEELKIYGKYDRKTLQPVVNYESSAVYALLVMLFLEHDISFSKQMYKSLIQLKNQEGGYTVDDNAHFFDNILPLLAEVKFGNKD